jgi:hypothetical protein
MLIPGVCRIGAALKLVTMGWSPDGSWLSAVKVVHELKSILEVSVTCDLRARIKVIYRTD